MRFTVTQKEPMKYDGMLECDVHFVSLYYLFSFVEMVIYHGVFCRLVLQRCTVCSVIS